VYLPPILKTAIVPGDPPSCSAVLQCHLHEKTKLFNLLIHLFHPAATTPLPLLLQPVEMMALFARLSAASQQRDQ
jgi:hypothetical protein